MKHEVLLICLHLDYFWILEATEFMCENTFSNMGIIGSIIT